ncbi:phage tail tape measure protein [Microbulbifer spongiae]|uniref:Phage tail tape measure protein n=1 Tax=Microbulbifer spongiae TaxID=2944933 RepID=A0ABY9EAE1_9GAMM|nr:phage tail tape measure protein [Microbulbifer sp. MI-G]WKD48335.1 phage tail tape measure protein [Microbulbifer sp. MI-G]
MSTRLEKLMFRIGLIDKASGPLGKLDAQLHRVTRHATAGGALLAGAAAGGWALQRAMSGLLGPAIEMERALAGVRTLGVAASALQDLERTALAFSARYGESATAFVASSYDIKSAISTLRDNEIAKFTQVAAVLARGTKANVSDITSYMGGMYNIFQKTADHIGRHTWAEQLAGQTALAVKVFRTDGQKMARFFESLGATATNKGWSMAEQMAVAGMLQGQMSASEGGTAAKAFISGLSKAQEKLGVKFETAEGLLAPDLLLAKINKLTLGMSALERGAFLEKNFGGQEAVRFVEAMGTGLEKLPGYLDQFDQVRGMAVAQRMAAETVDVFQQWQASSRALMTLLGKAMLPVITPLVATLSAANEKMMLWSERFPHLTKLIGTVTSYIAGLMASLLALAAVGGMLRLTLAGLTGVQFLWTAVTKTAAGVQWLYNNALKAGRVAVLLYHLAFKPQLLAAWGLASKGAAASLGFLGNALRIAGKATLLFSAALWANPITWVVVGVVALIAGLVLLVRHWDTVKSAALQFIQGVMDKWGRLRSVIEDNAFLRLLFAPLLAGVDMTSLVIRSLMRLPTWFGQFSAWLGTQDIFGAPGRALDWLMGKWATLRSAMEDSAFLRLLFAPLLAGVNVAGLLLRQLEKIPAWFSAFKSWLATLNPFSAFGDGLDWLHNKLRFLPGFGRNGANITLPQTPGGEVVDRKMAELQQIRVERPGPLPGLPQQRPSAVPAGGIAQHFQTHSRSGTHIENVNLYQPVSGTNFVDELEMAAG